MKGGATIQRSITLQALTKELKLRHPGKKIKSPPKGISKQAAPLVRRRYAFIFGGVVIAGIIIGVFVIINSFPVRLTEADQKMFKQYDMIRLALSEDDLPSAQKTAVILAGSYEGQHAISEAALTLAKADSLASAREAFSAASAVASKMARGQLGYYIIGCSMSSCPAPCVKCQMGKFNEWVQTEPTIANPYMGKASPTCGTRKQ